MKPNTLSLVLLFALLLPLEVRAGTVSFAPETTEIDLSAGGDTVVRVDLAMASLDSLPNGEFDSGDMVVGSDDGLNFIGFEGSLELLEIVPSFDGLTVWNPGLGDYLNDLRIGFFFSQAQAAPFPLGTLIIDAAGLGPGTYELLIDADFDQQSFAFFGIQNEPLYGIGTIVIIPDPATVTLLAAGIGLAMLRRDRRRRRERGTKIDESFRA